MLAIAMCSAVEGKVEASVVLSIGSSVPELCEESNWGRRGAGYVTWYLAHAGRVLRARDPRRNADNTGPDWFNSSAQPYLGTCIYPVCTQSPRIAQYPKLLGSQPRARSVLYPGFHKYLMSANAPAPHRPAKVMRRASVAPASREGQLVSALAIGPGSYDQSPRIRCLHQHASEAADYLDKSFPATPWYIHHCFFPQISASLSQDLLLLHCILRHKFAPPSAHTRRHCAPPWPRDAYLSVRRPSQRILSNLIRSTKSMTANQQTCRCWTA